MRVRLADVFPAVAAKAHRPLFIDGSGRTVWLAQGAGPEDDDDDADDKGDSGTGDDADDKSGDGNHGDKKDDKKDDEDLKKKLRLADKRAAEAEKKLRDAEDKDKSELEVAKRDLEESKKENEELAAKNHELALTNAFLLVNEYTWHDPEEALASATRRKLLEDVQDKDSGDVDPSKLKKALESLAKAAPHLVKKGVEDDTPGSTATHTVGKGGKGGKGAEFDRATLEKRYSALRR